MEAVEVAWVVVPWVVAVQPAPPELDLCERVRPVLMTITGDPGLPKFFEDLAWRDPPLTTVGGLCTGITASELKTAARARIKPATLKSLARLLDPTQDNGFQWPQPPAGVVGEKRKAGGNGNNAPLLTWEEQLTEEGVEPLDAATFRWGELVFMGVPKKGEAKRLNDCLSTLFDNTLLAMLKVRRACRSGLARAWPRERAADMSV